MSSLSSDAYEAHFNKDFDLIGNMIKNNSKKKQTKIETTSIAEYYNQCDIICTRSDQDSEDSNLTLSLFDAESKGE